MGDHRAPRGARVAQRGERVTPESYAGAGKRRAAKHAAPRGPLVSGLPSAPVLLGVAALSVSATGAVSAAAADASQVTNDAAPARFAAPANAVGGESVVSTSSLEAERAELVSRDSARDALADASSQKLTDAAEAQAAERSTELDKLANAAQKRANELEADRWILPVAPGSYRITEGFGDGVSWRGYAHTGLDFALPSGSPVFAVANGTVFAAQYAGGCGYMVEIRLDDGTEIKYCHNSSLATSVGAKVRVGDVIAYSGATGHSTGPPVHREVHPGGGDPVDPFAALVAHGAKP